MGMAHFMILLGLPLRPEIVFPLIRLAAILASVQVPQSVYICGLPLPGKPIHVTASPAIICAAHFTTLFDSTRSASALKACRIHPSAVHARTCVRVLTPTVPVRRPCERPILLARQSASNPKYKLRHAYEFALPPFPPCEGEVEANMVLSK